MPSPTPRIEPPYYPIVYVRGYAMREAEREETFHDAYYGFATTSVEKREAPAPAYFEIDVFEGQLIRFMKMKDYSYADAFNTGLQSFGSNPTRSLWISRFYDRDVFEGKVRSIEDHAKDLHRLVCQDIPKRLATSGANLGAGDSEFKVILIAHSMGGLVCRALIQNILPSLGQDPKRWIYRLVTMGTPHRGIDVGRLPDAIEDAVVNAFNPADSSIFKENRMREYLRLDEKQGDRYTYDVHSLGPQRGPHFFPVKRCLNIIGSDYREYSGVRHAVGNVSDGLVKQDRAYVVGGPAPADPKQHYPLEQRAYWANVHRAHSGRRGIVNSYETFENVQRFLFGDIRACIDLVDLTVSTPRAPKTSYMYDVEFLISIRGTGVYLHRREQDPCENAVRYDRDRIPERIHLHTGFMHSRLKENPGLPYSHFALTLRVIERQVKDGLLWDRQYPARPIFVETLEIRLGDIDPNNAGLEVQYRWLSDLVSSEQVAPKDADQEGWSPIVEADVAFRIPLRPGGAVSGELEITGGAWPDSSVTFDS